MFQKKYQMNIYLIIDHTISVVKAFIGDLTLGSTYLLMKSCRRSSESLKSLA